MKIKLMMPLLFFVFFIGQQIQAQNLASLTLEAVKDEMNVKNYVLLKATLTNHGYADGLQINNPQQLFNINTLFISQFGTPLNIEANTDMYFYMSTRPLTIKKGQNHSFFLSINLDKIKQDDSVIKSNLYDIFVKIEAPHPNISTSVTSNTIQVSKRM